MAMFWGQVYYIWATMAKELDNFDDEEMDEAALEKFDSEDSLAQTPVVRDYSDRRILI